MTPLGTPARTRTMAVALFVLGLGRSLASAAPPAGFDYYILEQSWLPEFCLATVAVKGKATKMPHPECRDLVSRFGATHPTVHGLWPQRFAGTYPTRCAGSPGCRAGGVCPLDGARVDDALEQDLADRWMPGYPNLARHEWTEHGTCSGLDQQGYFAATVAVAAKVPVQEIPTSAIGQEVDLAKIRTWWGEPRAAFRCDRRKGRQYLAAVRTCWKRNDDMHPGERIACPEAIPDTCKAERRVVLVRAQNLEEGGSDVGEGRRRTTIACDKPGQGPACTTDATCGQRGWLRCAKSRCCTNEPK